MCRHKRTLADTRFAQLHQTTIVPLSNQQVQMEFNEFNTYTIQMFILTWLVIYRASYAGIISELNQKETNFRRTLICPVDDSEWNSRDKQGNGFSFKIKRSVSTRVTMIWADWPAVQQCPRRRCKLPTDNTWQIRRLQVIIRLIAQ